MLDIFDELKLIVASLNENNLEYALCGGLAMAVHSFPRATIDIDILILSKDIVRIKQILSKLGYILESAPMIFNKGSVKIIRLSKNDPVSEDILSVDILEVTHKLESVWSGRLNFDWENGQITVISKDGLIFMKQLRGSGQDHDDIQKLRE